MHISNYQMIMKKIVPLSLLLLCCFACKKVNTSATQKAVTLQSKASFPFGAAIAPKLLQENPKYKTILDQEFNSITAENMMKMRFLQPKQGQFNYENADVIVNYALQNKKRVHGHTLLWHESVPDWVKSFQGDSLAWDNLLKTHILTVVNRYKGKVAGWDVVNEAFNDDGSERESIWSKNLGKDYIARAFLYARQADPKAILFYNDYGQEYASKKLEAILNMVADFKKRGIPIDGLGLQMHTNTKASEDGILKAINFSAKTGLKIHISELDIQLNPDKENITIPTAAMLEKQKAMFKMIVRTYNALPKTQKYGITQWNVGDADTWVRSYMKRHEFPLPFDDNYQKKPAYQGILEGLE